MADATNATVETWLYAGQRLDANGKKLYTAWCDPNGEIVHYSKLHGSIVGHAYAVEVIRNGDKTSVRGNPRYLAEQTDRHPTAAQLDTWRAEDRAATALLEGSRAEKTAAEDDELQRALDVLRRHHAKLRSYAKKGAFASYVLGEIQRPVKERNDG